MYTLFIVQRIHMLSIPICFFFVFCLIIFRGHKFFYELYYISHMIISTEIVIIFREKNIGAYYQEEEIHHKFWSILDVEL